MAKLDYNNTLKRLRNRYRLVIINDDTYEEIVTFRLRRMSVYIFTSVVFVLLVGFTISLISFTNLKYLIPGYGKQGSLIELRNLKIRADSLEQSLLNKQQYLDGIKKMLSGNVPVKPLDTTVLKITNIDSLK